MLRSKTCLKKVAWKSPLQALASTRLRPNRSSRARQGADRDGSRSVVVVEVKRLRLLSLRLNQHRNRLQKCKPKPPRRSRFQNRSPRWKQLLRKRLQPLRQLRLRLQLNPLPSQPRSLPMHRRSRLRLRPKSPQRAMTQKKTNPLKRRLVRSLL
jgi:hypothetical protein